MAARLRGNVERIPAGHQAFMEVYNKKAQAHTNSTALTADKRSCACVCVYLLLTQRCSTDKQSQVTRSHQNTASNQQTVICNSKSEEKNK